MLAVFIVSDQKTYKAHNHMYEISLGDRVKETDMYLY